MVDDTEIDVFILVRAFLKAGLSHSIQEVRDGKDAIAYLSGEPPYVDRKQYPLPQLMLLDLHMPRMGGFAVLEWLRSRPEFHPLPVIVLSASRLDSDIATAQQLGARDFKTKSSDFDSLVEIVKNVCSRWLGQSVPVPD